MMTRSLLPDIDWYNRFVYIRVPLFHPVLDEATRDVTRLVNEGHTANSNDGHDSTEGQDSTKSPPPYSKYVFIQYTCLYLTNSDVMLWLGLAQSRGSWLAQCGLGSPESKPEPKPWNLAGSGPSHGPWAKNNDSEYIDCLHRINNVVFTINQIDYQHHGTGQKVIMLGSRIS